MDSKIPLGHVIPSHYLLGWCGYCRGRDATEELAAWQVWACKLPEVAEEIRRQRGDARRPP